MSNIVDISTLLPPPLQTAVVAAVLNTLIPLRLGELVNTVSNLSPGLTLNHYSSLLWPSALSLIMLYVAQVSWLSPPSPFSPVSFLYYLFFSLALFQSVCTFAYISALSVVGEHLASRLRASLFNALLQQDMTFFDEHKTGELISR